MKNAEIEKHIMLFDTSIASDNKGDKIILKYCSEILNEMFPEADYINVPTHEKISKVTHRWNRETEFGIVCGTNLLRGDSLVNKQWKISLVDAFKMNNICLMGVAWNGDSDKNHKIDLYTKLMYKKLFGNNFIHSVRDNYTKEMLERIGITNVLNTACPTMWRLTEKFCKEIPHKKAQNVITTVTNYRQDKYKDKILLDTLVKNYDSVYIWIQSMRDIEYIKEIYDISKLKMVLGGVKKYSDILLKNENIDYIGTRLHAGIHALNYMKRTIIVAVDERATNIALDTGINILRRDELIEEVLEKTINEEIITDIRIPHENIKKWKQQFFIE